MLSLINYLISFLCSIVCLLFNYSKLCMTSHQSFNNHLIFRNYSNLWSLSRCLTVWNCGHISYQVFFSFQLSWELIITKPVVYADHYLLLVYLFTLVFRENRFSRHVRLFYIGYILPRHLTKFAIYLLNGPIHVLKLISYRI